MNLPALAPSGGISRLLLRRRWMILRWAAAGAVIFAAIALLIPSSYESVAQLMPPDQSGPGMLLGSALDRMQSIGVPTDLLSAKTPGAVFVKTLSSQTVENALIDKFDLRRVYRTRYWETARKQLEANSVITEDRRSGVISIRVRDHDPRRAQMLCAAYVDELSRRSTELSTSSARREREFLEQRLALVKQEVDRSATRLGQFSSNNTTLDISQQAKAMVESAAGLQGRLVAAQSELEGLRRVYGDQNVRVLHLEGNIAELRRSLKTLTGDESSAMPVGGMPSLRRLPVVGVTYMDLLRQAKMSEATYEALTGQYELARVQEAKDVPSVRLLDPPGLPERKAFPPRAAIILVGALLGMVAAVTWLLWSAQNPGDPNGGLILEAREAVRQDLLPVLKRFHKAEAR